MCKLTVVVPVYKVEPYLARCIGSILTQTCPDFELILIDDGTPDGCGALCDEWLLRDDRIRVIHQMNGGLSAARNTGIDFAFAAGDGEWLTFIDSDDDVQPEYFEVLIRTAAEQDAEISACNNYLIGPDNPNIRKHKDDPKVERYSPDRFYKRYYGNVAWAKLYHRDLFRNVRYPVGRIHEDDATTYKLLFQCDRIAYSHRLLYNYYKNPGSIMRSKRDILNCDKLYAFFEQLDFFQKRSIKELVRNVQLQITREYVKKKAEIHEIPREDGRASMRDALYQKLQDACAGIRPGTLLRYRVFFLLYMQRLRVRIRLFDLCLRVKRFLCRKRNH